MIRFFGILQVHVVGSSDWNQFTTIGSEHREHEIKTLRTTAQNLSYLLKKLHPDAPLTPKAKLPLEPKLTPPHPKPLKVVAFNGRFFFYLVLLILVFFLFLHNFLCSFHLKGNTTHLIDMVFAELRQQGIECEMMMIGTGVLFSHKHHLFLPFLLSLHVVFNLLPHHLHSSTSQECSWVHRLLFM